MSDFLQSNESEKQVINVKESWDVNYWCDELNLKAEELKEIVREVGPHPHDVRLHIAKRNMMKWPLTY